MIVQDNHFDATASITICAFTTDPTQAALFRILVEPSERNGLRGPSNLMPDKLTTVSRRKVCGWPHTPDRQYEISVAACARSARRTDL